jgi:hypothetical protein
MCQHTANGIIDRAAETAALCGEVDEGNWRRR